MFSVVNVWFSHRNGFAKPNSASKTGLWHGMEHFDRSVWKRCRWEELEGVSLLQTYKHGYFARGGLKEHRTVGLKKRAQMAAFTCWKSIAWSRLTVPPTHWSAFFFSYSFGLPASVIVPALLNHGADFFTSASLGVIEETGNVFLYAR